MVHMRPLQICNSILLVVYGSCEPPDRKNTIRAGDGWKLDRSEAT